MNKVILQRNIDTGKETLGELAFNGFTCKTLERPWLDNKRDVSCIPTGEYICEFIHTLKFPFGVYHVTNVPNRDGILIHKGNYFYDVIGCILLGTDYTDLNKDGQRDIINSTITVNRFNTLLNKQPFILKIISAEPTRPVTASIPIPIPSPVTGTKVGTLPTNINNKMQKYIMFYTTGTNIKKMFDLTTMSFESEGIEHQFTDANDAVEKSTVEDVIFWDNTLIGTGKLSA